MKFMTRLQCFRFESNDSSEIRPLSSILWRSSKRITHRPFFDFDKFIERINKYEYICIYRLLRKGSFVLENRSPVESKQSH